MSQKQEKVKTTERVEGSNGRVLPGGTTMLRATFDEFIVEVNDLITVVAVDLGARESQGHTRTPDIGRGK
jgi:hypothetical protein